MDAATVAGVMMAYVACVTGLPVPDEAPIVDIKTHAQIQIDVFGEYSAVAAGAAFAYYDPDSGRIVLPDTWKLDSPYNLAQLAHETTHYMQDEAGLMPSWHRGELERMAYNVQFHVLLDLGSKDPLADSRLSKAQLMAATLTPPRR